MIAHYVCGNIHIILKSMIKRYLGSSLLYIHYIFSAEHPSGNHMQMAADQNKLTAYN